MIRSQLPFLVDDACEPELDVAVIEGNIRDGLDEHPSSALLLIEIADSSLPYDQTTKASVYAKAQIAEYWIVNLINESVDVYRLPQPYDQAEAGYAYAEVVSLTRGEVLTPLARPGSHIGVSDLLP